MRGVVDLRQVAEIQVGVDLRGGNVGMTKQIIGAALSFTAALAVSALSWAA